MITRIMAAILLVASSLSGHAMGVEDFVNELLKEYPKARLLDIYKSCFQDYMGAEHLVGDTASARGYLMQELATIEGSDLLPWYYEPCGTDGRYVRVSLRAIQDGLIGADALLNAFIASANGGERPSVESWATRWHQIIGTIDGMGLSLPYYEEDKQFIEQVLGQGKYAISHSPDYRDAYAPHYRIVRRDIFERDLMPSLPHPCCSNGCP